MNPLFLGMLIGMRHALEPDHLAAVATMASTSKNPCKTARIGFFWGMGHTLALVGVTLLVAATGLVLPETLTLRFEQLVACMLIGLGSWSIYQALFKPFRHPPGHHEHHISGPDAHVHLGPWTFAGRPLLVGLLHGLAGSGALTVSILVTVPSAAGQIAYAGAFGLGSTLGMALLSGMLGVPVARLMQRPMVGRGLQAVAGLIALGVGVMWGIECSFPQG